MSMTLENDTCVARDPDQERRRRRRRRLVLAAILVTGSTCPWLLPGTRAQDLFRTTGLFKPDPRTPPGAEWGAPVFSVWRNLPDHTHVFTDLEFSEPADLSYEYSPPPIAAASADTCCAARPGQPLTLVRDGKVIATGSVGRLHAADVPTGALSRMVFFDAEGMPDSLVDGRALPQLAPFADHRHSPRSNSFDLYVVGRTDVAPCEPEPRAWDPSPDGMKAIVSAALSRRAIHRGGLPSSIAPPGVEVDDAVAACLAELLRTQGKLSAYTLASPDMRPVEVQTLALQGRSAGDYTDVALVRVHGPGMAEPELIAGRLQYFIRVGDVACMVVVDHLPGTGAWGYGVYALLADRVERLLWDTSWST